MSNSSAIAPNLPSAVAIRITAISKAMLLALGLFAGGLSMASDAENTKELNDEIRATLVKTKAIMKRFDDGRTDATLPSGDVVQVQERRGSRFGTNGRAAQHAEQTGEGEAPSGGCQMNVGNANQTQSRGAIRRVTTVVTGNVIQMCK